MKPRQSLEFEQIEDFSQNNADTQTSTEGRMILFICMNRWRSQKARTRLLILDAFTTVDREMVS